MTHRNITPVRRESPSCQRVRQHQVIHVHPVHPGSRVTKPEDEQPALHIHLKEGEGGIEREREREQRQLVLFRVMDMSLAGRVSPTGATLQTHH